MKVISLLQPWASQAVMGVKIIETRSRQTAYGGWLLIHASRGKKGRLLCSRPPLNKYIQNFRKLPFGAIIGSVTLQDIVPVERLPVSPSRLATCTLKENAFASNTQGRYAWIFSEPLSFQHIIPAKGSLHLWNYLPVE